MQKFNPSYVLGVVDGEGSFTVYVKKPDKIQKRQARIELKFIVKLNEEDLAILQGLKDFF